MSSSSPGFVIVISGVSGSGKSTVARTLAERIGARYVDADDFHPSSNVAKMSAGIPLTDEDRLPWLQRLVAEINTSQETIVLACSALKRIYRDTLRTATRHVRFVELSGSREILEQRLQSRDGHFMPADLMDSQLASFEPLEEDEAGLGLDLEIPLPEKLSRIENWLRSNIIP
ncbi:MAG: gluconokinase [Scrofimicrobium sp.]